MTVTILALAVSLGASGAPTAPSFTAISSGLAHTCVVTGAGGVKCWGSNKYGQLGNGVSTPCNAYGRCPDRFKRTPVDVVGLGGRVKAIAAGSGHTCALTSIGGVKCWGHNASGQLGNGHKACIADEPCPNNASGTPVNVVGLTSGVTAIAAGEFHTCAITSVGGVKCWGSQTDGELGNRTGRSSSVPVDVVGLSSGVSAIAAGAHRSCAITSGGAVRCWGGVLFAVAGLPDGITAIAMGGTSTNYRAHACAITSGGGAKCWGDNGSGELGNGSLKASPTPVDVVGLGSGVRAITATDFHTCALTVRGGVKCWGGAILGDGSAARKSSIPVDVVGLASGVKAIAAGRFFTCALPSVGGVKCWGYNYQGRLGNGSAKLSTKPVDVRFSPKPRREATRKQAGEWNARS